MDECKAYTVCGRDEDQSREQRQKQKPNRAETGAKTKRVSNETQTTSNDRVKLECAVRSLI